MKTLKEQAKEGYDSLKQNFTAGQLAAITKQLKNHRRVGRRDALAQNPWAVINDERRLNNIADRTEGSVEGVKAYIDKMLEGKEFIAHPNPDRKY